MAVPLEDILLDSIKDALLFMLPEYADVFINHFKFFNVFSYIFNEYHKSQKYSLDIMLICIIQSAEPLASQWRRLKICRKIRSGVPLEAGNREIATRNEALDNDVIMADYAKIMIANDHVARPPPGRGVMYSLLIHLTKDTQTLCPGMGTSRECRRGIFRALKERPHSLEIPSH